MIPTVIIDQETLELSKLKTKINHLFPDLDIKGTAESSEEFLTLLQNTTPELVFVNPSIFKSTELKEVDFSRLSSVFICISDNFEFAQKPCYWCAAGYLLRTVDDEMLISAVEKARGLIVDQKSKKAKELLLENVLKSKQEDRLIGIPTIEGFEIIPVDDIIRCEGLQKCTRIVTTQMTDIVSSYNIGEFKKLLHKFGIFFSPHRSHLVNMLYVRKFKKAGSIMMKTGTDIPMAKKRKEEFLNRIIHF